MAGKAPLKILCKPFIFSFFALVAHRIEQGFSKPLVAGSIPAGRTSFLPNICLGPEGPCPTVAECIFFPIRATFLYKGCFHILLP